MEKCPYCGGYMESGFVQSARWVFFTNRIHNVWFLPDDGDIRLTKRNWTRPAARAWCCRSCKKIVIDYGADAKR